MSFCDINIKYIIIRMAEQHMKNSLVIEQVQRIIHGNRQNAQAADGSGGRYGRICGNIAQDRRAPAYGKQALSYGKIHHGFRLANRFPVCITPNPSTSAARHAWAARRGSQIPAGYTRRKRAPPPPERRYCRGTRSTGPAQGARPRGAGKILIPVAAFPSSALRCLC